MKDSIRNMLAEGFGVAPEDLDFENRTVPGSTPSSKREFRYIGSIQRADLLATIKMLIDAPIENKPTTGGALTDGCEIVVPGGDVFQCFSYKGDLAEWRIMIERATSLLNIKLAWIEDDAIVTRSGDKFSLKDCKVSFY